MSIKKNNLKVSLIYSDRFHLLLFGILLVLYGMVFSGLLIQNTLSYSQDIQTVADIQAAYNEGYTFLSQTNLRLENYLNSSSAEDLAALENAKSGLISYLSLLREEKIGVYTTDMRILCETYLQQVDMAQEQALNADADNLLDQFQNVHHTYSVISIFYPYSAQEVEEMVSAQNQFLRLRLISNIRNILIGLVIATIVILLLIFAFARYFLRPVEQLAQIANATTRPSEWVISEPTVSRKDEMGLLFEVFYHMMNQMRTQFDELLEKQRLEQELQRERERNIRSDSLLAQTKLQVFQSQINSHFLFNSLNTISRIAYIEKAPKAQEAADTLAKFLRCVLNQFSRDITIAEEFETIECYVQIQKLRFGNRIQFESVLDPDIEDVIIPAMTVQPLVENAIIHGVGGKPEGFIRYGAEITEDGILLSAWDDGMGMSEEAVHLLLQKITSSEETGENNRGIALINVYHRLNLLYPNQISFLAESEKGVSTKIGFLIRR